MKIGAELQDGFSGKVHVGLRLQKQQLFAAVRTLPVKALKLTFIYLAAELFGQDVQCPETAVVAGSGIIPTRVAQADDQPAFTCFSKHGLEQIGDGSAAVNVGDGTGEDGSHIQELDLAAGCVGNLRNGVQEDHFLNGAFLNAGIGGAGQNAVSSAGVNFLGAADLNQSAGGIAQRTSGIDHIIVENAGLAGNVTDDIHNFALVGLLAALINDGKTHMDFCRESTGSGNGADIGGNHNELIVVKLVFGETVQEIIDEGGAAKQMVQRNIEEALDLSGMEVHGQNAVGTGGGDHVGHQLCGDGVTALGLAVLTGVAKIGDNRSDTTGAGTAASIDHNQQFHQMVVNRLAGGLDQKNVGATNGFFQRNGSFTVGKGLDGAFAQVNAQLLANRFGKFGIGVTAENFYIISVSYHLEIPHLIHSIIYIMPTVHTTGNYNHIIALHCGKKQQQSKRKTAEKRKKAEQIFGKATRTNPKRKNEILFDFPLVNKARLW